MTLKIDQPNGSSLAGSGEPGSAAELAAMEEVVCNLCGADDYRVLYEQPLAIEGLAQARDFLASTDRYDRYGRVVRCRRCGLSYTNPRPAPELLRRAYGEAVDDDYAEEDSSRSINAHFSLHTIKRHAKSGRLLDVGCSTGYFLNAARVDFEACGVEPSSWAADHARNRLRLEVHQGTLEDAALPEAHFDVVTLNDVIEHLSDPAATLREVHRLLRPGGLLYLVTPDISSLSARLLRGSWWGLRPAHLYYFSGVTLGALLSRTGFELAASKSYGRVFTYGYWLSRLRHYPAWIYRGVEAVVGALGLSEKFLYLDTRDSLEVCAIKKVEVAPGA